MIDWRKALDRSEKIFGQNEGHCWFKIFESCRDEIPFPYFVLDLSLLRFFPSNFLYVLLQIQVGFNWSSEACDRIEAATLSLGDVPMCENQALQNMKGRDPKTKNMCRQQMTIDIVEKEEN